MDDRTRIQLLNLRALLADLYRTTPRVLDVSDRAGIDTTDVDQTGSPKMLWWRVLDAARNHPPQLDALINTALADFPGHIGLELAKAGTLVEAVGDPKQDLELPDAANEVVVGRNDFLSAQFLEMGARVAQSVVRVALKSGGFGTGFLIREDVVLTNQHVLPDLATARDATIQVGVEDTLDGISFAGTPYLTDGKLYVANKEHDWAIVRTAEPVPDCQPISLDSVATVVENDRVFIVQHPGGGPKVVALGINNVVFASAEKIQYLTDTMPGSSGSPIFDRRWQLVGLHRRGGWLPVGDTKRQRFQNEGVPLSLFREHVLKAIE